MKHSLKLAHDNFIYGQDADTFDAACRAACTAADYRDEGDENPSGRVPVHKVFRREAGCRLYRYSVKEREARRIGQCAVISKVEHKRSDQGNAENDAKKYA